MGSHQGVSRKISSYLNVEKITMAVEENDAEQWLPDRYFAEVCDGLN